MEIIEKKTYVYKALDGKEFKSEQECKDHENSLPRHLIFCLQNKYTAENLLEVGVWCVGYTLMDKRTEWENGTSTTNCNYTDVIFGYYEGSLSNVIKHVCENDKWWYQGIRYNSRKWIKKVKIEKV